MAVLAISALGAYAAPAVGLSASVGWAIGSLVGNALFGESAPDINQVGPRLTDLSVTSSAYGTAIQIPYGTIPFSGNIIDSGGINETKHVQSETAGGKGFGGQTITQTTYSYDATLAVSICEGPIDEVLQIYANERLVYDNTGSSDVVSMTGFNVQIFKGTEDQEPSTALEEIHGAGNVPAYRGVAYAVFHKLPLGSFGNSIPSFRFVVTRNIGANNYPYTIVPSWSEVGSTTTFSWDLKAPAGRFDARTGLWWHRMNTGLSYWDKDQTILAAVDPYTKKTVKKIPVQWDSLYAPYQQPFFCTWRGKKAVGITDGIGLYGKQSKGLQIYDAESGALLENLDGAVGLSNYFSGYKDGTKVLIPGLYTSYLFATESTVNSDSIIVVMPGLATDAGVKAGYSFSHTTDSGPYFNIRKLGGFPDGQFIDTNMGVTLSEYGDALICTNKDAANNVGAWIINDVTSNFPAEVSAGGTGYTYEPEAIVDGIFVDLTSTFSPIMTGSWHHRQAPEWDDYRKCFWLFISGPVSDYMVRIEPDGSIGEIIDLSKITGDTYAGPDSNTRLVFDQPSGVLYYESGGTSREIWEIDIFDKSAILHDYNSAGDPYTQLLGIAGYHSQTDSFVGKFTTGTGLDAGGLLFFGRTGASGGSASLGAIVADICDKCGYEAAEYDATALNSTTVEGFRVAEVQSGRTAISTLRSAFLFDIIDTEGILRFKFRNDSPIVTINKADMAARYYGEDTPRTLEKQREHSFNLPHAISVAYLSKEHDYEVGQQRSIRLASRSEDESVIQVPIVLTEDEAAQLAEIILHGAYMEREQYSLSVSSEYAYIEPSDVIIASVDGINYEMRIVKVDMDRGILKLKGIRNRAENYASTTVGGTLTSANKTITFSGPTQLAILDCPGLRDEDLDAPYYYLAANAYSDNWKGGSIFKSMDGSSFDFVEVMDTAAAFGFASGLSNNATPGQLDLLSSLSVSLNSGSLSSVTYDTFMFGESNVAAIGDTGGWEIISFKDATLNGTEYILDGGIRRGLFGTEWAMDQHTTIESFVLLTEATLKRIRASQSRIGVQQIIRAVTYGGDLYNESDNNDYLFTNGATNLKPYSPAQLSAVFQSSGDIEISFKRRDRKRSVTLWAPPQTDQNKFDLDVYDAEGSVVRTLTALDTDRVVYTTDMQTVDFGSTQRVIRVRAYQVSEVDEVGRGYPADLFMALEPDYQTIPLSIYSTGYLPNSEDAPNAIDGDPDTYVVMSTSSSNIVVAFPSDRTVEKIAIRIKSGGTVPINFDFDCYNSGGTQIDTYDNIPISGADIWVEKVLNAPLENCRRIKFHGMNGGNDYLAEIRVYQRETSVNF